LPQPLQYVFSMCASSNCAAVSCMHAPQHRASAQSSFEMCDLDIASKMHVGIHSTNSRANVFCRNTRPLDVHLQYRELHGKSIQCTASTRLLECQHPSIPESTSCCAILLSEIFVCSAGGSPKDVSSSAGKLLETMYVYWSRIRYDNCHSHWAIGYHRYGINCPEQSFG
jgi:hypothetical protein